MSYANYPLLTSCCWLQPPDERCSQGYLTTMDIYKYLDINIEPKVAERKSFARRKSANNNRDSSSSNCSSSPVRPPSGSLDVPARMRGAQLTCQGEGRLGEQEEQQVAPLTSFCFGGAALCFEQQPPPPPPPRQQDTAATTCLFSQ